jgi:hypothetical protein
VTRDRLRSFFVAFLVSTSACGLSKGGLLVPPEGGEPIVDATAPDAPVTGDEPSGNPGDDGQAGDADATVVDATGADARDASEAGPATVHEGGLDVQDAGDAGDAPSRPLDATPDVVADAPTDAPFDTTDAPFDAAPAPLDYDGGIIADPTFFDDEWVTFCAALVGCGEVPSLTGCVALLKQPTAPEALIPPESFITAAGNVAPDCQAVRDALGDGLPCSAPDTCSGGSLVTCRWGFRMTIPCGPLGLVCSGGAGNAGCGFGDCNAADEGKTYCAGTYVTTCQRGRYVPTLDCNAFGASCAGAAGSAACAAQGGMPCTTGTTKCDNGAFVVCMAGRPGSIDCPDSFDVGFSCFTDVQGTPFCALGTSCDPGTTVDICNPDGTISFCNAGMPDTYGCTGANLWSGCSNGACVP